VTVCEYIGFNHNRIADYAFHRETSAVYNRRESFDNDSNRTVFRHWSHDC
jgi:hypothetical protein